MALGINCKSDLVVAKFINTMLGIVGSLINFVCYFILKLVSISLLECLRYKTFTARIIETRQVVSNITCFQLLLLILLPKYENDSPYSYSHAKILASAVLISYTISPFIEFVVEYSLNRFKKWRAEGSSPITSISQYYELYAGPEYMVHWKYSLLNLILLVSFAVGFVLPILFPLCLVAMSFLYLWQKLTLAQFYRQPPNIAENFNDAMIFQSLFWFKLLYLLSIMYVLRNESKFSNDNSLIAVDDDGEVIRKGSPPTRYYMVLLYAAVVLMIYDYVKREYKPEEDPVFKKVERAVNSNKTQTYFESLRPADKEWLVAEEEYLQYQYKIVRIQPDKLIQLKKSEPGPRQIITTPFYDLLALQPYRNRFEYVPRNLTNLYAATDSKSKDQSKVDPFEESKNVALMLNLAYLTEYNSKEDQNALAKLGSKLF